jgi:hypothetical protein
MVELRKKVGFPVLSSKHFAVTALNMDRSEHRFLTDELKKAPPVSA